MLHQHLGHLSTSTFSTSGTSTFNTSGTLRHV